VKNVSNPSSSFCKFSTGNLETLANCEAEVREELKTFHKNHYFAENMTLCVLGKESIQELEDMITRLFSQVPSSSGEEVEGSSSIVGFDGIPFSTEHIGRSVRILPIAQNHEVEVLFPLPPTKPHYTQKPSRLLSHLIGHESKGSILSELKRRGLASTLMAGLARDYSSWSLFSVKVRLTDLGFERVGEVLDIVFSYTLLIQEALNSSEESGKQQEIEDEHLFLAKPLIEQLKLVYDEAKQLGDNEFLFTSKYSASQTVSTFAENMKDYAGQHTMSGDYKFFDKELNTPLIKLFSDCLVKENCILLLSSPTYQEIEGELECTDEWYGTRYGVLETSHPSNPLSAVEPPQLSEHLHFPLPNPYIASNFQVVEDPMADNLEGNSMELEIPQLIYSDPHIRFPYHPKDCYFSFFLGLSTSISSRMRFPKPSYI